MRASRTETARRRSARRAARRRLARPQSQVGPPISLVPAPAERSPAAAAALRFRRRPGHPARRHTKPKPWRLPTRPGAARSARSKAPFPRRCGAGVKRSFIAAALPLLAPSASPVLQDLARRLLLSDAASPAGADAAGPARPRRDAPRPSARARRCRRGAADDGRAAARSERRGPRPRAESSCALPRATRRAPAATVEDRIARYQNLWWDRALIACQALAGDGAKAALGLSLLARAEGGARCGVRCADRRAARPAAQDRQAARSDAAARRAAGRGEAAAAGRRARQRPGRPRCSPMRDERQRAGRAPPAGGRARGAARRAGPRCARRALRQVDSSRTSRPRPSRTASRPRMPKSRAILYACGALERRRRRRAHAALAALLAEAHNARRLRR